MPDFLTLHAIAEKLRVNYAAIAGEKVTDLDTVMSSPGALLQYRVLRFMKACALHDAGELTDEEYALWKSKFPAFLGDFYEFWKQAGRPDSETFDGDSPAPSEKPQSPERNRERKINSGR